MDSLEPNQYRGKLRKKLVESDEPKVEEEKEVIEEAHPMLGDPTGGALDDLRRRLFRSEESVAEREDEIGGGPGEYEDVEELPVEQNPEDELPDKMGLEPDHPMNEEDLMDLATDTVSEVLLHLKDLRDKFKQENPKKAQLIRALYNYIEKGKEKIAKEMMKAEEEARMPQPEQLPR